MTSDPELAPERYRELFELSPTATALFDRSGRCRLSNRAMRALLSAGASDLSNLALSDLLTTGEQAAHLLAEMEARHVIRRREIELLDAQGQAVPVLLSGRSLEWQAEPHFELSFTDLSRVRTLDRAASRDLAGLAALVLAIPDGLLVVDASGRVSRLNPALRDLLGLEAPDAIGRPYARVIRRLVNLLHDPEAARLAIGRSLSSISELPRLRLPLAGRKGRVELSFFPVMEPNDGDSSWGLLIRMLPGRTPARRPASKDRAGKRYRPGEPFDSRGRPGAVVVLAPSPNLRQLCHTTLARAGYQVHLASELPAAVALLHQEAVELTVVEWPEAEHEGPGWIRALGRSTPGPILVVMPSSRQTDLLAALDAGADDYLTRPFQAQDLLARAQFTARQAAAPATAELLTDRLEFDELTIDLGTRRVWRAGQPVDLTPTEFDLLALLAQHRRQILSHEQLIGRIWGAAASRQRLFTHINRLRTKLEPDPAHPRFIVTRWGLGYVFQPD